MAATYPLGPRRHGGVPVTTHAAGASSVDPVARATAETMTPDLAAIAALDAYLAACGVASVAVEEVVRCPSTSARS